MYFIVKKTIFIFFHFLHFLIFWRNKNILLALFKSFLKIT